MEVIGPRRIHSPFPSLPQPQILASFHQSSTAGANTATTGSSSTGTVGRRSSKRGGGGREGACPPRFERAREDKRQAGHGSRPQQQQRGSASEAGNLGSGDASSASAAATTTTVVPSSEKKGRENTTKENRRQPRQRKWTKTMQQVNHPNGSGQHSPRPSSSAGVGSRANRRRKLNSERLLTNGENVHHNHHHHQHHHHHHQQQQHHHQQQQLTAVVLEVVADPKPKSKVEGRKKHSAARRRGTRTMSSVDSGKGEDLSSSCESSVFDPLSPSTLLESREQRSQRSSCSSIDDFHDALSHPASDDDGVNSSAFVTPFSTRSHSPTGGLLEELSVQRKSSVLSNESSIDELQLSLKRLSEDRQSDLLESPDSRVIQPNDHMTSDRDDVTTAETQQTAKEIPSAIATTDSQSSSIAQGRVPTGDAVEQVENHGTNHLNDVCDTTGVQAHVCKGKQQHQVEESDAGNSGIPDSPVELSCHPLPVAPTLSPSRLSVSATAHPVPPCSSSGSGTSSPSPSTPSQSPALSTPSPSPSPSPLTVTGNTVTRLQSDDRMQVRYETDQSRIADVTNNDATAAQEDEWPDLHDLSTNEVRVQPHPPLDEGRGRPVNAHYSFSNGGFRGGVTGPCPSLDSTNREVIGHPLEPHPQNAAAAYPHMIHSPPPPYLQWFGPIPTTGSYGFYSMPFIPQTCQAGLTGYYPGSPQVMWSNLAAPQIPHPHPPYYHHSVPNGARPFFFASATRDDAINGAPPMISDQAPPTSVSETDAQSSERDLENEKEGTVEERVEGREGETEERGGEIGEREGETEEREGEAEEGEGEMEEREEEVEGGEGEGRESEVGPAGDESGIEFDSVLEGGDCDEMAAVPTHHPLEVTWVMWYDKLTGTTRNHRSDYRSSLKHLHTISSVEDFWRLYNNIRQPSHLDRNSNYHFFKEGIDPLWEDAANIQGGKWVLTVKDDECTLDMAWEELLLAMIGGLIHNCDAINGAVVSRRKKGDRVALWTRKKSAKVNLDICADLLKVLVLACGISTEDLPGFVHQVAEGRDGLSLVYMYHADALKSGTSYQNSSHIHLRNNCESLIAKVLKRLS